ncbi:hypothetical protein AGABI2DRAFT_114833 [Agaricus bisporus var. bisporus H97]|uniref:hypothetical protein n=1 Tax=Agaricus bisporus var. bisporus (strain H97 / ATCC MYA-4626 / FGSC 10389) TaxID=936046 RepID=UPI00029F6FF2|nr:hypothetical protein AGABI2DRAFT_114833 [Agaricus bisporus var. bisporus H97]EKV49752.1 hypothetical protein AGABI2DRAFT_114833 [Agaricus bisporus var. bisporus H97]
MSYTPPSSSSVPIVLYEISYTLPDATRRRRLTELTIISLFLSTGIIILSIVTSLEVEGCFFALLASALTMIHNVTTLLFRPTFKQRQQAELAGLEPPKFRWSIHNFMINALFLFMIPLWIVVIGWMTASLYLMGIEILEKWQWGPAVLVVWPLKFTLMGLEIAVLWLIGCCGLEESSRNREADEGHAVEIKWCDDEVY